MRRGGVRSLGSCVWDVGEDRFVTEVWRLGARPVDHEICDADGGIGVARGSEGVDAVESGIEARAGQYERLDRRWISILRFTGLVQKAALPSDDRRSIVGAQRGTFVRAVSVGHPD